MSSIPGTPGDYFWGGVGGTYFWVDPKEDMFAVFVARGLLFEIMKLKVPTMQKSEPLLGDGKAAFKAVSDLDLEGIVTGIIRRRSGARVVRPAVKRVVAFPGR